MQFSHISYESVCIDMLLLIFIISGAVAAEFDDFDELDESVGIPDFDYNEYLEQNYADDIYLGITR